MISKVKILECKYYQIYKTGLLFNLQAMNVHVMCIQWILTNNSDHISNPLSIQYTGRYVCLAIYLNYMCISYIFNLQQQEIVTVKPCGFHYIEPQAGKNLCIHVPSKNGISCPPQMCWRQVLIPSRLGFKDIRQILYCSF